VCALRAKQSNTDRALASGAIKPGSRAAVLSQVARRCPGRTSEQRAFVNSRASALAAGWERARKAAATSAGLGERSEQSIHREGTCFFVPDRRRSKRLLSAIRARDVRADLQEEPTKSVENRAVFVDGRFVGSDEDGGSPANIERAERAIGHTASASERSNQTRRRPSTRARSSSMTSAATRSSSRSGRDTSRPRMARSRVTSPETPSRPKSRGQRSRESCIVPE
jgi:hypothetical protein